MELLTSSEQIQKSIKALKPSRIAVAFIGMDWQDYIDTKSLKELIVSPNFGSNPRAISEVAKAIGWENVHFLDTLHSKIYIGKKSLVLGSANLSNNAMNGLKEVCVKFDDAGFYNKCSELFEEYKAEARSLYPTVKDKKEELQNLFTICNNAVVNKIIKPIGKRKVRDNSILNFSGEHFYIDWFEQGEVKYNYQTLKAELNTDNKRKVDELIVGCMPLAPGEKIQKNKWMLCWALTADNKVSRRVRPHWLYVHDVFDEAVTEKLYPNAAIERTDMDLPQPPFKIKGDKIFYEAFAQIIESGKFNKLIPEDGVRWYNKYSDEVFEDFMAELTKTYKRLKNKA